MSDLGQRADAADRDQDLTGACAVFNLAALLASDVGRPELARVWCHRQADLLLGGRPRGIDTARLGLEPVINLARLDIRAGRGARAATAVQALYAAVATGSDATVDGVAIPATIVHGERDRAELVGRLWPIVLATIARALASVGHWRQAHAHLSTYRGIGQRMFDGRQIAVVAHLAADDAAAALAVLADTTPGDPWENVVTACLAAHSYRHIGEDSDTDDVVRRIAEIDTSAPALTAFHTRLTLAVLDAVADSDHPGARQLIATTIERTVVSGDGYAARDVLAHPDVQPHLTDCQLAALTATIAACGLDHSGLDRSTHAELETALEQAERVIAEQTRPPHQAAATDRPDASRRCAAQRPTPREGEHPPTRSPAPPASSPQPHSGPDSRNGFLDGAAGLTETVHTLDNP